MTQYAEARKLEEIQPAELSPGEHAARTSHAVAAGHDAELNRALASVSWERRGLFGALRRRPRPQQIPGTSD
jgi:hypothetical protein